ncbi:alpha/beta hydrolase [Leptolyngbya sp. PCC 6406]|uniref:alpha/beta hydrolase n=1 Tax=Leptolyngbya sp. PCC 6406 TaxID=1173264 RepID=UPI0002AC8DA6|nr:alpha/beta hydrolase [Leptolyngbya sp. PCC 6406]
MDKTRLRKLLIGELSWARLVRSLLFIYGFLALYVFFRADSMIFLPQPASYDDSGDIIKLPVTAEEQISARYLSNPDATYTLLYIHGNAEDLGDVAPLLERLQSWGFSIFAYDYRGYGTSDGHPSERNAYQDAEAAYTYLTQQLHVPPEHIIVYGRSVGSGSATQLATRYEVAGLILESSFTSIFRVVVPVPLLPFDKFPNLSRLSQVNCPVLVMHGQADDTIPMHHGQTLYEAASEPKMALWVEGAGHNDFTWVAGDRHQHALLSFQDLIAIQE